jgi:hypothetical protein
LNKLFLSFTKVAECVSTADSTLQCDNSTETWKSGQNKVLLSSLKLFDQDPVDVLTYYSMSAVITLKENTSIEIHLHERLHEFINENTLSYLTQATPSSFLYMGEYAVFTVLIDSRLYTALRDNIYYYNQETPTLLMQDPNLGGGNYHLGDWGTESSGSSWKHMNFKIGKYTELVMKDAGFESSLK